MSVMDITVCIEAGSWQMLDKTVEQICAKAAKASLAHAPSLRLGKDQPVELAIILADDGMVHDLNRDYRGQDKPTNVLSFAALDDDDAFMPPDAPLMLGDVFIAYETVLKEAERDHKAPLHHLTHLVVHGVLHLLGYDHENDEDADEMEHLEIEILAGLGIADPYADRDADTA